MKSFRSEIEDPLVERDVLELEAKIRAYQGGKLDEERFRTLRLARGVYGQRQYGVQMIRIKLPYGKVSGEQLDRIAKVSDEYSNGLLHITTRQDVQIHYVSLDRTPELWAELEKDQVTLREACGNTVRNITASDLAGIDPDEVFDVRPFADALFKFFLRNPISQELGRKIKIAFSGSDKDDALTFMHDIGFIAKSVTGTIGFKVVVGGGLGSQSRQADVLYDFVELGRIIPISEAIVRVFERYGERSKRMKARLKFLVKSIGLEEFKNLVEEELEALETTIKIEFSKSEIDFSKRLALISIPEDLQGFENWMNQNVLLQKQHGLYAVGVKVRLGNITTVQARAIAKLVREQAGNELTFTLNQNIILRHVEEDRLSTVYKELQNLGLAEVGFNRISDITACPGTDTCNLGIASSTGLSVAIEKHIVDHFSELVSESKIQIKISGCMNACGQHMIANIGFQGMSIKTKDGRVLPATQVLLGGGVLGDGKGRFADKVVKIPSKRTLKALTIILNDYQSSSKDFLSYYDEKGERYFYDLLKPLIDISDVREADFVDWGSKETYTQAVGVGECAGVIIDLVSTLLRETEEKIENAKEALARNQVRDSIYHSYQAIINTAKALLISEGEKTNSHASIIDGFDEVFVKSKRINIGSFKEFALAIKEGKPSTELANKYIIDSVWFYKQAESLRKEVAV